MGYILAILVGLALVVVVWKQVTKDSDANNKGGGGGGRPNPPGDSDLN